MTLADLERLITRERVRTVTIALLIAYGAAAAIWFALIKHGLDLRGQPMGADFIIFYASSSLALKGKAILAYAASEILKAEQSAVSGSRGLYLWCYPPTFQLLIEPLARLSYPAAFAMFSAIGAALYIGMTRLMATGREALLLAAAFPAVFQNFMQGQTGFLTCAILGAGLLLIDRRPWLAGAILGLLTIKPHLAILLPVLTLGTGRWKLMAGAALSAGAFIALSLLHFGFEPWVAFLTNLPNVSRALATGALPLNKTPTVFVMVLQLGMPIRAAQILQGVIAAAAAGATLIAWRRAGPWPLKAGLACLGTLIAVPYAFDYDLMLLAVPVGVGALAAMKGESPPGVRLSLALLYCAPLLVGPLWAIAHVQLVPIIIVAGYATLWRQLAAARGAALEGSSLPSLHPA